MANDTKGPMDASAPPRAFKSTADVAAIAAGWADYSSYLKSNTWRRGPARLAALRIACGRCRICNEPPRIALECHHRTYSRLGREAFGDIIAVCEDCHDDVTLMTARRDRPRVSRERPWWRLNAAKTAA